MINLCLAFPIALCLIAAVGKAQTSSPQPANGSVSSSVGAARIVGTHPKLQVHYATLLKAVRQGDSLGVAEACYLLGKRYTNMGDFPTANRWFMRSLRIREPLSPSEDLGKLYLRIAEVEVSLGYFTTAFIHAHRALVTHRKVGTAHGVMSAYHTLGGVHLHGWRAKAPHPLSLDSALHYFQQAEAVAQTLNDPIEIAYIHDSMGSAESFRSPRVSVSYLKRALAVYDQHQHSFNMVRTRLALATIYLTNRQANSAERLLNEARRLYDIHHLTDFSLTISLETLYAQLYRQRGDWKRALMYQNKAHELRYAALNADRDGAIARLNVVYETEKRDDRIQSQQRELKLQEAALKAQRLLTYAILGLLVIAVVAGLVFFRLNRKNKRISRQNAELVKEQSHRINNHLQAVSNLLSLQSIQLTDATAKRAVEESQLRVQAVALLHRRLSGRSEPGLVELDPYIRELTRSVLKAFGLSNLQPQYKVESVQLQTDKALSVGLIINEIITNACKYAFSGHDNPELSVLLSQHSSVLRLSITDNGPGFAAEKQQSATSYGMRLIQLQSRQLQGHYEFNNYNGVQFNLTFPA